MKKLIYIPLSPLKTIGMACLWFLLTTTITMGISKTEKEYYAPTDTPNPRFMVNGQRWQDFLNNPKPIQTKPDIDCMDSCLKVLENGNYLYFNDSPLIMTESEYQIKDGQVIPISYKTFNAGQMLIGAFGALFIIWLLTYFRHIYQIRHDKPQLIIYHQKLAKNLLILAVGVIIIMGMAHLTAQHSP